MTCYELFAITLFKCIKIFICIDYYYISALAPEVLVYPPVVVGRFLFAQNYDF